MELRISHDRADESLEAKARWFRSLPPAERMAYFDEMIELIVQVNPKILHQKHVEPVPGRIRVLELT